MPHEHLLSHIHISLFVFCEILDVTLTNNQSYTIKILRGSNRKKKRNDQIRKIKIIRGPQMHLSFALNIRSVVHLLFLLFVELI